MKYVCVDDGAVAELISGREYQSIDFEEGNKLIQALAGRVEFVAKLGRILLFQDKEGVFLSTLGQWKSKRYLVVDTDESALFTQLRSTETLTAFQKLLRFCSKYWTGGVYNNSEKIITGTSKAVIFPLPFSASAPFRVVIEREPLKERLQKRDMDGRFLLVYKSGRQSANSASEEANETNFRRVFERLPEVYQKVAQTAAAVSKVPIENQVASTELPAASASLRPVHMPFDNWLPHLTAQQRKFIFAPRQTPHRLLGPAGTGKTLSLILRAVWVLRQAEKEGSTCHAIIITHSEATRAAVKNTLTVIDPDGYQDRDRKVEAVCISVETLASLCAQFLRQSISESEFIDRDAQDSKLLQLLYIEQALVEVISVDLASFRPHLSEAFRTFVEGSSKSDLATLFQHEISVLIKGRAGDSFDVYRKCPSLLYGLPIANDADKGLAYCVFRKYQDQLESSSQFDTDDVVISAVGQLDTPIWRRRRLREGYDFLSIDETHLFNINELHVFHHFTRKSGDYPISFTVDQAQAVGDRGWNDVSSFDRLFGGEIDEGEERISFSAVFRSSPAIREVCHSILASGATLFTNFQNTLTSSQSAFTAEDERMAQPVRYFDYADDNVMVEAAFKRADELQDATDSTRAQILITSLSDDVINLLRAYITLNNKPATFLERRGDYTKIGQAEKSGHLVVGHADFVGGLEFNAVIIVAVDKGRVPADSDSQEASTRSYASYSAHNRLYVAASRAKYALEFLGVKSRGPSELLQRACLGGLVDGLRM